MSTVKYPYIIMNNKKVEDDSIDEVIDEVIVTIAFDFNTILGRGVIRSLDRSGMAVFVSAGLFIAFATHICLLRIILFTKYVLFFILSLNIGPLPPTIHRGLEWPL